MPYLFFLLFTLSLIAPSSTTEFFTKGEVSAGGRYLVDLADDFDRERVIKERTIIAPSPQPIHKQLQNIDENLTATTGDVAAIFKTILTLRHNQQPFKAPEKTANELLGKQFMAYQIMDIACQSLLKKPISLAELKEKTIIKTHEQESLRHFSDAYITSLIPDTAVTMIQYPEPSREINYLRLHGQPKSQLYTESEYEISSANWPALRKVYCRGCGELIKEQQRRELYQKWYKDFIKALEEEFLYLFKKVEKVTADENLGFHLTQYDSSKERPLFKLTGPKKDLKGILTTYYW